MRPIERHDYDVVVIGAGGAGLRAAIEARLQGKRTAIISKSLFGKAHTVMAEGGCAAAMGNVNPNDNWQVHFRDTMRGGKFLNNWRMAELHAKEAPDRVWELETYGALFDRTKDGKISQRNFGGHEYPRLAHVGDRTGLELIRTLQQKIVSLQQEDFKATGDYEATCRSSPRARSPSCSSTDGDGSPARSATSASRPVRPASRRRRSCWPPAASASRYKVTSNSWEYTGDGHALALRAGRDADQHGVPAVPPDRHGLAAVGEGDPRHRVGPRRRRRAAQLRGQAVHVRLRPGRVPRRSTRTTEEEARPLVHRPGQQPAPARAAAPRRGRPGDQLRGQGRPRAARTAACSSTSPPGGRPRRSSSGCRRCTTSSRSWPTSTSPRSRWRSARPATT